MVNIAGIIACLVLLQNKHNVTIKQDKNFNEENKNINDIFLNSTPYVPFYQKPTYGYIKSNEDSDKINRGLY